MFLGVKSGIQLYFGSERENCKDIVPFSNPIVPGRELRICLTFFTKHSFEYFCFQQLYRNSLIEDLYWLDAANSR